ncbi:MAG: Sfum_1244 family protein [Thermodesulfobacteriota bacterium]
MNETVLATIRHNCDISDARDHGIYSICNLVLRLRNLYKWEHGVEPWQEPAPPDLLDWIEAKENFWETIVDEPYRPLVVEGGEADPHDPEAVNGLLAEPTLLYGAGYGRSLKSIFFLAEKIREEEVAGCPVVVLGRELATELASPFAMLQDRLILIRREPLRYFFWDHIQEIRSSSRLSLHHALRRYGILKDGRLDHAGFRERLDHIVDAEIPIFIHHEVGEMLQEELDSDTLRRIIAVFPDSIVEFVARAVKDVLADTHPDGMLGFIIRAERDASLGLYTGLLAGLRRELFPEIAPAFARFLQDRDWRGIERARRACRDRNLLLAATIRTIAGQIGEVTDEEVMRRFAEEVLTPLGLDAPQGKESQ